MKDLYIGLLVAAGILAYLYVMCLCSIGAMAAPSPDERRTKLPERVTVGEAGAHYCDNRPRRRSTRSFWRDGNSRQRRLDRRRVLHTRPGRIGTV